MGRRRRYERIEPYRTPERAGPASPSGAPPGPPPGPPPGARSHARPTAGADGPEPIAPVDVDGVLATTVGTVLWALAFLVLLPFRGWLEDNGAEWWLWTCTAGVGIGLLGIAYCRRRRDRLAATARRTRL